MLESAKNGGIESVLPGVYTPKKIFQHFVGEIFNRTAHETMIYMMKHTTKSL